jgi:Na+-transporting methylmalonyl-CoA/oxaloacetate decarboxylase gamma subunit
MNLPTLAVWNVENFGDAAILSVFCIAIVFLILVIISLILMGMNKIRALDVKEKVKMKDGTELDEDAMAAVLVATLDYRREYKEDVKVVSCELIEEEPKKKLFSKKEKKD